MSKKILITGANGGFGQLTVKSLLQEGHKVTASMRDVQDRNRGQAEELAGVGAVGVQETFTAADWHRLFDINVFGVQRVIRAALPQVREQGSGLLIQVSSLLGRITIPYDGPDNASKWALEALYENYRIEWSRFGIDVVFLLMSLRVPSR